MRYYVFSDIHGFYSLFCRALRDAGYDEDRGEKKILILGDLFDRGEEALALQEHILKLMEEDRVILIRGNHEDLFEELVTVDAGRPYDHHVHNGTFQTLLDLSGVKPRFGLRSGQYLAKCGRETPLYTDIIPAMRDYLETERYVFVHAWVPCRMENGRPAYDANWRQADPDAWRQARWINAMDAVRTAALPDKTVVSGHVHCSYGHCVYEHQGPEFGKDADFSPYYTPGLISIDACTAHSGKMNCLVIEEDGAKQEEET